MLKIKRIIALFSFVVKYKIVLIIYDGLIFFRIKTNVGFGLHIDALTLDGEGGAGGEVGDRWGRGWGGMGLYG